MLGNRPDVTEGGTAPTLDAVYAQLELFGWPRAALSRTASAESVLLVAVGDTPRIAVTVGTAAQALSNGYSAEADMTVAYGPDELTLHHTLRWDRSPGDAPVAVAEPGSRSQVHNLFSLVAPDVVAEPGRSGPRGSSRTRHLPLPAQLASEFADLRMRVMSDRYLAAGADASDIDVRLIRLFHQLLFARFHEDRHRETTLPRIAKLVDQRDAAAGLASTLEAYRAVYDSPLFERPAFDARDVPPDALRRVIRATVEPWTDLHLDFSITQRDVAGRLYESYLARQPIVLANESALLPGVTATDRREESSAFYTPNTLARLVARQALNGWLDRNQPSEPSQVRVLDPACGSGAFLIAAFRILMAYFRDRLERDLTSNERRDLLTSSIFGFDIDPAAVMIAQLQLLEEADLDEVEGPLPDMNLNIRVGDSLLRPPASWEPDLVPTRNGPAESVRPIGAVAHGRSDNDDADDDVVVESAVPAVDWTTHMEGRFYSAVLMNPPFGAQLRHATPSKAAYREHLRSIYTASNGPQADIAFRFVELADRLAGPDGALGLVLPRVVIEGSSGAPARRILQRRGVQAIRDYRGTKVFPSAHAYVCTIISDGAGQTPIVVDDVGDSRQPADFVLDPILAQAQDRIRTRTVNTLPDATRAWTPFALRWDELALDIARLEHFPAITVAQGTQTGANERFTLKPEQYVVDGDKLHVIGLGQTALSNAPLLVRGRDISPFAADADGDRLVLPRPKPGTTAAEADEEHAALVTALGGLPRNVQPGNLRLLAGPKVLLRAFAKEPSAAVDRHGDHIVIKGTGGALVVATSDGTPVDGIAAFLNSSLVQWYLRGVGSPRSDETIEIKQQHLTSIPWPDWDPNTWARLAVLGAKAAELRIDAKARRSAKTDLSGFDDSAAAYPMATTMTRTYARGAAPALRSSAVTKTEDRRRKALDYRAHRLHRRQIDDFVFDLLGIPAHVRAIVADELIRSG